MVIIEYVDGQFWQVVESFCFYVFYEEFFCDYVNFLRSNLCYVGIIGLQDGVEFVRGLQKVGYVIDLGYVDKLS